MAQTNSNDSDTNDSSDISSQLSEIKESCERKISELHQEFSHLKDLMMAIVNKNNSETQLSSSKGPSKPPKQQGFDNLDDDILRPSNIPNKKDHFFANCKTLVDTPLDDHACSLTNL